MHALDPRVKFVLNLAFITTTALTPVGAWPVYVLLLSIILAVIVLSELGVSFVLKRALLALPFVLAALPVIFTLPGPEVARFSLGPWLLTISTDGLDRFTSIALKSWISMLAAVVLATSTPFPQLLIAMRAVRVPRLLVGVFGLMWRYLFVMADEALRLMRARAARSGESAVPGIRSGGSIAWRGRVTGGMAGSLFLRAIERSERIYNAMLSRGYDGEVRLMPLPALRPAAWLTLICGLIVLALLLGFGSLIA